MTGRTRVLRKLERELERLKRTLDLGHDLHIKWIPGFVRHAKKRRLLGEVIGKDICVYAKCEAEALEVARHEFLEHVLTEKFTTPYQQLLNTFLVAFEEQAYREKEALVKKLVRAIWGETNQEGVEK